MNILENFSQNTIYLQFEEFLKTKYPQEYSTFTSEEKLDKFETVFVMGLNQAKKFLKQNNSCDLLFQDKPPRADMIQKLGNVLWELENIESFPIVPPLKIRTAINKVLSSRDKRTRERYLQWILQYSHHQREFNKVDLTQLVNHFPKEKIQQGGIW